MMHKQQQPYAELPSKVWPSIDFCIQMMINRCVCKCMCVRMKMFAIISTDIFASGTVLYSVVNAITLKFVYIFFLLETYTTHFPLTHAHIAFFFFIFFYLHCCSSDLSLESFEQMLLRLCPAQFYPWRLFPSGDIDSALSRALSQKQLKFDKVANLYM